MDRRAFLSAVPILALGGCGPPLVKTQGKVRALLAAAHEQTRHFVRYEARYVPIDYPNGDVPDGTGVCADVVIRAYRAIGIDLQKRVHEDMLAHFDLYPKRWGLKAPDPNIDHRRVPNLMTFLERHGTSLPFTQNPKDYRPGDLITNRPYGGTHIAIVSDVISPFSGRLMVIQNAGAGTRQDDDLLRYPLLGHYRYGYDPA